MRVQEDTSIAQRIIAFEGYKLFGHKKRKNVLLEQFHADLVEYILREKSIENNKTMMKTNPFGPSLSFTIKQEIPSYSSSLRSGSQALFQNNSRGRNQRNDKTIDVEQKIESNKNPNNKNIVTCAANI